VLREHQTEVHPVKLISAQDEKIFVGPLEEVTEVLAHRVGRSLIPFVISRRLLGGKNMDEIVAEVVEAIGARDVAVERLAVVLCQDIHLLDARVDTVADGDVDDPAFRREWHRRLGAIVGEREET
jgi:hypothetical protein